MGLIKGLSKSAFVASLAIFSASYAATVKNPVIWSDSPDPSIVRVEDSYYMVTTTMHYAPGVPVFKSTDLAQWRTIGYVYETLADNNEMNLEGGKDAYGKGSWASSIRYRESDGYYYVLTPSYTTGKTHLYKTKDIEAGGWTETQLPFYHDPSLFFDDDGTAWVFYGSGDNISYVQLNDDASGVKAGGRSGKVGGVSINAVTGTTNYYVQQEGSHMEKVDGEYYLFTISWPAGACRTEVVYRSKNLLDGFTGRIFLQDNGVAQGGIFDTPDGKWYALLFRDSGPIGRISHLVPTVWKDGWPEPEGGSKKAPASLELPNDVEPGYGMVTSDDFDSEVLPLEWQWNHNPDNKNWSLSANPGYLRITTGRVDSRIVNAKNTLTQRTYGPKCVGRVLVDGSGMKDGDMAGLAAMQDDKGFVALAKDGGSYKVVMFQGDEKGESQKASEPISGSQVYLRLDFDIPIDKGTASFYYSTDGSKWNKIGTDVNLSFSLHFFTGNRFGLFNFATKTAGGYADFDWFKIGDDENDEIYLSSTQDTTPPTPYGGVRAEIPGRIEAENYDEGKQNRAYYDNDRANQGGAYREDGVDIVAIDSADPTKGYAVGYTGDGEWLKYSVNVKTAGEYTVFATMATNAENVGVKFFIDDKAITETVVAEAGEDWSNYKTVSANTSEISAGEHVLKMQIVGDFVNIDNIVFVAGKDATSIEPVITPDPENPADSSVADTTGKGPSVSLRNTLRLEMNAVQSYGVYDLKGKFLGRVDMDRAQASLALKSAGFKPGVYMVRAFRGASAFMVNTAK